MRRSAIIPCAPQRVAVPRGHGIATAPAFVTIPDNASGISGMTPRGSSDDDAAGVHPDFGLSVRHREGLEASRRSRRGQGLHLFAVNGLDKHCVRRLENDATVFQKSVLIAHHPLGILYAGAKLRRQIRALPQCNVDFATPPESSAPSDHG